MHEADGDGVPTGGVVGAAWALPANPTVVAKAIVARAAGIRRDMAATLSEAATLCGQASGRYHTFCDNRSCTEPEKAHLPSHTSRVGRCIPNAYRLLRARSAMAISAQISRRQSASMGAHSRVVLRSSTRQPRPHIAGVLFGRAGCPRTCTPMGPHCIRKCRLGHSRSVAYVGWAMASRARSVDGGTPRATRPSAGSRMGAQTFGVASRSHRCKRSSGRRGRAPRVRGRRRDDGCVGRRRGPGSRRSRPCHRAWRPTSLRPRTRVVELGPPRRAPRSFRRAPVPAVLRNVIVGTAHDGSSARSRWKK